MDPEGDYYECLETESEIAYTPAGQSFSMPKTRDIKIV